MMSQIFTTVLILSAVGSVLIAVLLALKPITRRVFGSHWQYYIWLAVLIVIVLPIRIGLPREAVQISGEIFDEYAQGNVRYTGVQEIDKGSNIPEAQAGTLKDTASVTMKDAYAGRYDLFAYIWIAGAISAFMAGLIRYGLYIKTLGKNSVQTQCPQMAEALIQKKMKNKVCAHNRLYRCSCDVRYISSGNVAS